MSGNRFPAYEESANSGRLRRVLPPIVLAIALTVVFWGPLWTGGGFVGSGIFTDVSMYALPQKSFYADRLHAGEFPLWNNLTGYGYPLVAESQTGAFYPFNILLYGTLPLNAAYSAGHLLHYVLAFLGTWLYSRRIGLSSAASALAALVYTYGWFPVRSYFEWTIIGGTYLPLALWFVESFLLTRQWRHLMLLSFALAVQLLAGHFNLAFITHLVLIAYIPLRMWFSHDSLPAETVRVRGMCALALAASIGFGFALASVQLLPTWELKQQSNRETISPENDPADEHIPVRYWLHVVVPWYAAGVDVEGTLGAGRLSGVAYHLYFGLVPLALLGWGIISRGFGRRIYDRRMWTWFFIGTAAFVYTSGWLVPLTRHLPGFSFFVGPSRYGMVATFAVGILAAAVLDDIRNRCGNRQIARFALMMTVLLATTTDLWLVNRTISAVKMVDKHPVTLRSQSIVRDILRSSDDPVRVHAPVAPNSATLLGVSAVPAYLTFGPAAYFDPRLKCPETFPMNADQIEYLRRVGVTHIVSPKPGIEQATLIWKGFDPFLSQLWNWSLYLYKLDGSRGRVAWSEPSTDAVATMTTCAANRIAIETESVKAGRLVLTDLMYPGWTVTIDGQPAEPVEFEKMFRAVDVPAGRHSIVWSFRPRTVFLGASISAACVVLLVCLAFIRIWHRRRSRTIDHP